MRELIPHTVEHEIAIVSEYNQKQVASWEELVALGIEMRQRKDDSAWVLGAIALLVKKYYINKKELTQVGSFGIHKVYNIFSHEIDINPSTLRSYRSVVSNFLKFCGVDDLKIDNIPDRPYPMLCFGILDAVATLPDKDKKELLDKAELEHWPIQKLRREAFIRKNKDKKVKKVIEDGEKVDWLLKDYIKLDEERKVIYLHRLYKGYDIRWI